MIKLLLIFLLITSPVYAASTGDTLSTEQTPNGWSNATRLEADDSSFADRGVLTFGSGVMHVFGFDFSIPSNARIDGYYVTTDDKFTSGYWSQAGNDFAIYDGTDLSAYKDHNITDSEVRYYEGSPTDRWGEDFAVADINTDSFQVWVTKHDCHPAGQTLLRPNGGSRPVENIRVGDILKTPTGTGAVLEVHENTAQEFRWINTEFIVTPTHPIMTRRGHEIVQKEAKDFTLGDILLKDDGSEEEVWSLHKLEEPNPYPIYSFTVEGGEYYTGSGHRVHNKPSAVGTVRWGIDVLWMDITYSERIIMFVKEFPFIKTEWVQKTQRRPATKYEWAGDGV